MIRLFVLDLDGCVSFPFKTPHWESISKVRAYNIQSQTDPSIPGLSICTGRPFPYAEAVAQWLDIQLPIVFESGGGVYFPDRQQIELSPVYIRNREKVKEIRNWLEELAEKEYPSALFEFSKVTDAGIVHSDLGVIDSIYQRALAKVSQGYPEFEVHHTEASVNIILKECNKGAGIRRISELTGIPLSEVAYIGDSSGDLAALQIAGRPFAPANATAAVRKISEVMQGKASKAVLEAYEKIMGGL